MRSTSVEISRERERETTMRSTSVEISRERER